MGYSLLASDRGALPYRAYRNTIFISHRSSRSRPMGSCTAARISSQLDRHDVAVAIRDRARIFDELAAGSAKAAHERVKRFIIATDGDRQDFRLHRAAHNVCWRWFNREGCLMFYLISKVTNNVPPTPRISPISNAQSKLRACSRCRSRPSALSIAGPGLSDQVVAITEPKTAAR